MNEAAKLAAKAQAALVGTAWEGRKVTASISATVGGPENKGNFSVRISVEEAFAIEAKNPQAALSDLYKRLRDRAGS